LRITHRRAAAALLIGTGLLAAACGSSSKSSSTSGSSGSSTTTATSGSSGTSGTSGTSGSGSTTTTAAAPTTTLPATSASSFTLNFSAMTALKGIAAKGSGSVGVILPDTTSSARYVEFDAPYLKKAFAAAGLKPSQYTIQNAQGSDATALTDAKADITNGAKVILVDPEDPAGGVAIEKYAKAHGVKTIDYDRLTLGGSRDYYVSFNNIEVGTLLGKSLVSCV
jgi:D-xylose transport system substrate-binding protein